MCHQSPAEQGIRPQNIHADVGTTLGITLLPYRQCKLAAEFSRGREIFEDNHRSGPRAPFTNEEKIDARCLTITQIANAIRVAHKRIENILYNELDRTKVSARRGACHLTHDQKRSKLITSQRNLALFEGDTAACREGFKTHVDCCVHHFELATKKKSMQWKHSFSSVPKKEKGI